MMTVYSGTLRFNGGAAKSRAEGISIIRINVALVTIAVFGVIFYLFLANFLTARQYALEQKKNQLIGLRSQLVAGDARGFEYDLKELMILADHMGMVEAKNTESLIKNSGFAFSKD